MLGIHAQIKLLKVAHTTADMGHLINRDRLTQRCSPPANTAINASSSTATRVPQVPDVSALEL